MGGMCSGLGGKDGLELRIEKALQEIIKHKNARAAAIKAGEKPEGGDGQFQFDAGDDIQASFNRIILKFPVLRRAISGIRQVFRTFDTDNSGTIDKKELGKCLAALGAVMTEQDVNHMFKVSAAASLGLSGPFRSSSSLHLYCPPLRVPLSLSQFFFSTPTSPTRAPYPSRSLCSVCV
jgi:EF-hand domain